MVWCVYLYLYLYLPKKTNEPDSTTQDAAKDVVAAVVAGRCTVSDRESQGADVVRQHTVGHVEVANVVFTDLALVGGDALSTAQDRIGYIV